VQHRNRKRKGKRRAAGHAEPRTRAQLQDAVNGARLLLVVDALRQYGLATGGPLCNYDRCHEMLGRGRARGVLPQEEIVDEALAELLRLPEVDVAEEIKQYTGKPYGDMRPGDLVVMTPKAVAHGLHRRGRRDEQLYGRFYGALEREPGRTLLRVQVEGTAERRSFGASFWRKVQPDEQVDTAALLEEGERLRRAEGLPPIPLGTGLAMTRPVEIAYAAPAPLGPEAFREMVTRDPVMPLPEVEKGGRGYIVPESMRPPEKLVMGSAQFHAINARLRENNQPELTEAEVTVYDPADAPPAPEPLAQAAAPATFAQARDVDGRALYVGDEVRLVNCGDRTDAPARVACVKAPRLAPGCITVQLYGAAGELLRGRVTLRGEQVRRERREAERAAAPPVVSVHVEPGAQPETVAALGRCVEAAAAQMKAAPAPPAAEVVEDEPEEAPPLPGDLIVWAVNPHWRPSMGGRNVSSEVSRRKCRLAEVPVGWEWEAVDDDD
jgi:hypothetical protein